MAFVQCSDTGVYTGNTTGIGSGVTAQVLGANTGIGHLVVLMVQSLSTSLNSVTSVTSAMGTFVRVNSYVYANVDDEIWVCLSTTGAANSVTVTCPSSNAWQAFALEWSAPATGAVDGGANNQANAVTQTITVAPLAAGNLVAVFQDSVNNFTDVLGSPWSIFATGVYWNTVTNGTSAAWQVAASTASVTASWAIGGGPALAQAAVVQFSSAPVQATITAQRLPF